MAPKLPASSKGFQRPAKRKAESEPEAGRVEPSEEWTGFGGEGEGIEMASDEEDTGESAESSDVEEFPEIEAASSEEGGEDEDTSEAGSEEEDISAEDEEEEDGESAQEEDEIEPPPGDSALMGEGLKWDRKPGSYPDPKVIKSSITGEGKKVYPPIEPEYDSDSSTEDDPNRVGRIPMHWYDDLPHIGYDINGKRILRPAKGDELDKFLAAVEDPTSWLSGFDHTSQKDTQLTEEELDLIRRLQDAEVPDASYNPYEDTVEWFTGEGKQEIMPLTARPEPKSRWQPSKWEKQKILKIVRLIRAGHIVPNKPKAKQPQWYSLWSTEAETSRPPPLVAPKVPLPKHAESYNPPEEYLPDQDEIDKYEDLSDDEKVKKYLPKKYDALRHVPAYEHFIHERQNRLLDLYLAPRIRRVKLHINPDSMLPSLPSPQSLRPFPVFEALKMSGGGGSRARCVSVSPDGVWTVSGDEDGVVRLRETFVGREAARWKLGKRIGAVEWCPRKDVSYFLVGIEDEIFAFMPPHLSPAMESATLDVLVPRSPPPPIGEDGEKPVKWSQESLSFKQSASTFSSPLLVVTLPPTAGLPKQITFHRRGDYFATVSSAEGHNAIWIHQASKRHSQSPFKKIKGSIQRVLFHPNKPHFFVATQRYVSIYDLSAQKLLKTLYTGSRWISSMDIHPTGDHLIVGGYDKKLMWFDLDLGNKPYKVLRYHTKAIRSVAFSPNYPLFASSSDDGTIQIFHARVYSDLMTDALIVPLKVLRGHVVLEGLGVMELKWTTGLGTCWLVSAGADGEVRVWCN
ncbi:Ribosome biogenesis protein erb1 [Tulasnella sp. 427]|nr:Ribosome biogenesis protein erb1 [Tulasnella sp. 427]